MSLSYTVKANLQENRLYVTINGSITMAEADTYVADFNSEFDQLKPGMTILFDFRNAGVFEPAAAEKMEANKRRADSRGLGKFAFVLASAVLKGQMIRNYGGTAFGTIEDAVKYLES